MIKSGWTVIECCLFQTIIVNDLVIQDSESDGVRVLLFLGFYQAKVSRE